MKNGGGEHSSQHPSQKNEHGTDEHEIADTEFIDEVSRDRHRPCFKKNKQRIDKRNVRIRHGRELLFQPGCKKREGILKVRNDDHRHDASSQLNPPVAHDRAQRLFREIYLRGVHVCHTTSSDKNISYWSIAIYPGNGTCVKARALSPLFLCLHHLLPNAS